MMSEAKLKKEIVLRGQVVGDKMDKTCVVYVERLTRHPRYKKIIRRSKKYLVHDEFKKATVGDLVDIKLVRPLSKTKSWLLKGIVSSDKQGDVKS